MRAILHRPLFHGVGGTTTVVFGSSTERAAVPRVPSLLFDIELEDVEKECTNKQEPEQQVEELSSLFAPWSQVENNLMLHVRLAMEEAAARGQRLEIHELADRLRRAGHSVRLRTALGGGWGGECLRNLRYEFLTCTLQGADGRTEYIIDPKFREQFEIAHPTPRYALLLESIPREFVGSVDRITPLVEHLCAELAKAFSQADVTLPPWRTTASMLSKWRPRRSIDADISMVSTGLTPQPAAQPSLRSGGRTTAQSSMLPASAAAGAVYSNPRAFQGARPAPASFCGAYNPRAPAQDSHRTAPLFDTHLAQVSEASATAAQLPDGSWCLKFDDDDGGSELGEGGEANAVQQGDGSPFSSGHSDTLALAADLHDLTEQALQRPRSC